MKTFFIKTFFIETQCFRVNIINASVFCTRLCKSLPNLLWRRLGWKLSVRADQPFFSGSFRLFRRRRENVCACECRNFVCVCVSSIHCLVWQEWKKIWKKFNSRKYQNENIKRNMLRRTDQISADENIWEAFFSSLKKLRHDGLHLRDLLSGMNNRHV